MTRTTPLTIGVFAPALTLDPAASPGETAEAARLAEELGFESLWTSDLLTGRCPMLDPLLVLASAATVTTRLRIGTAALVPALHPLPGLAQRLATLQYLSGGRLLLGVDAGDSAWARWRGGLKDPAAWRATGIPFEERDARLDETLSRLPGAMSGEPGQLDITTPDVRLTVPAEVPPLFIGGENEAALERAVRHGDHWFPALASPAWLTETVAQLRERAEAAGRPMPGVTIGQPFGLGDGVTRPGGPNLTRVAAGAFGISEERSEAMVIDGSPERAAERIAEFAAAGADRIVFSTYDPAWQKQYELLAEAVALLP
ncbi:LLM class flavin-dependent oxidoreductase [Streptomyces sp. AV19]|uniref:LLM class flavin-dependent oxidoreductase n=1 Tax=Streptomyces sp. AV19 TaxID=2793068 RepID=UPI0018FED882|nr:LLM class flavin-dependent oxidoreductase [Streptomyces sp. AV19]MBH1939204.1 LLM class flavin-dependent oxidoreductase [Streptomyces sp. AV19]MDG4530926.1 LLM class flavin-dependent oxidoreductase [Streptomyces sp. AV19]